MTEYSSTSYLNDDIYPVKRIFNATVDYYRDRWTFTLGADNIFDTYPQLALEGSNFHGIFRYPSSSPFGSQGAFVYGTVRYAWLLLIRPVSGMPQRACCACRSSRSLVLSAWPTTDSRCLARCSATRSPSPRRSRWAV